MKDVNLIRNYNFLGTLFSLLFWQAKFKRDHPDYFYADGITVFCGAQGSGKTYSAVQYAKKLIQKYPKSILVSNIEIHDLPEDYVVHRYTGPNDLSKYENGEFGVIYLIDEIHIDFNSLESKSIPASIITEICQQRKQRKCIIGTSQVYSRLAKPFREQMRYAVLCRSFFNVLQFNTVCDGDTMSVGDDGAVSGIKLFRSIYFRDPRIFECYDTYAKILRLSKSEFDYERRNKRAL